MLAIHVIWLFLGIFLSGSELLPAMPSLTHFSSTIPSVYIYVNLRQRKLRWWACTNGAMWLISFVAALATISGWTVGHFVLQCVGSIVVMWQRAIWIWLMPESDRDHAQEGRDGSIRSTTNLVVNPE